MPKDASTPWTPYGLEHIRAAHLLRKRLLQGLLLLALLGLGAFLFSSGTTTENQILDQNGNQIGSGIQIADQKAQQKKDHVTVGIEPGRATTADTGSDSAAGPSITRNNLPDLTTASPINFAAYLKLYSPYILVGLAAWFLAKRRGKHDEVNFGVYKGSMPLEMITASHDRHVFTKRHVKRSVFGKARTDHLPREVIQASDVAPQEGRA